MDRTAKLWIALGVVLVRAFTVLGVFGREVYRQAPPIPERVVTEDGRLLMTKADILHGQQVWQSAGGQEVGSIWGHGAYQAPDWSADWLHREVTTLVDELSAQRYGKPFDALGVGDRAAVQARVQEEMRTNRYDAKSGVLVVSNLLATAMAATATHYRTLFGDDPSLARLRQAYALQTNALPEAAQRQAMTAFFFWTAWACTTERPGLAVTYTNNWPHDELVGNHPTSANVLWSLISIVLLIAGVGALVWYKAFRERDEAPPVPAEKDPLRAIELTPSMRAIWKYAAVVIGLFVLQVLTGALTAHYTVEGQSFFGIPIAQWIPYAVSRTWHLQLAVFWIATAFLAAGLFLAPAVGGREPKYQRLGVHVLFGALIVVVLGSLAGEWLSVQRHLGLGASFWFGHQGYEYLDLGRAWQIALFVGLVLWLVLMLRGLWPAIQRRDSTRQLVILFAGSSAAIGLFYGAGFFYSATTHLSVMEYWRWWSFTCGSKASWKSSPLPPWPSSSRDLVSCGPPPPRAEFCSRPPSSWSAAFREPSTTCTSAARQSPSWPSAPPSALSKSYRSRSSASRRGRPTRCREARPGCTPIAGPCVSSWASPSGISSAQACSASSSIRPSRSTTCRD